MAPRKTPAHLSNMTRGTIAAREDLTLLEGNPNQGDVEAVAASLLRFRQKTPIVVTPEKVIVKGNTTVQAADLLVERGHPEWAELWVIADDEEDVAEQLAYALADNRTGRLGHDDPERTLAMLDRIPDHAGIGYDVDDLADLRAMIEETTTRFGDRGVTEHEPSFSDLVDEYAEKGVRSLVLDLPLDVFGWFVEHGPAAREKLGVATNAELLVAAVAETLGIDRP